ncbi:hypothetical protein ACA910_010122 [Epithemia clementina (nom. ined.)]
MFGPNPLCSDYRFKFPGDPDSFNGWSNNFEYTECGTTHPTPRDNVATLFLITNHTQNPWNDLIVFIQMFATVHRCNLTIDRSDSANTDYDGGDFEAGRAPIVIKENGKIQLHGTANVCTEAEDGIMDPNVGYYALLTSIGTPESFKLLQSLYQSTPHGGSACLEHKVVTFDLVGVYGEKEEEDDDDDKLLQVTAVTGIEPETSIAKDPNCAQSLSTRFFLHAKNGNAPFSVWNSTTSGANSGDPPNGTLACCHLSYRDGSHDPSIGPTIETIAVHKNHRGKNYLPLLYETVHQFVGQTWTLECLNNDTETGNIMLKVTQLTNAIVDVHPKTKELITDKEFFYKYAGFGVRTQKGLMAHMFSGGRPKDEEGVVYHKLLTPPEIKKRANRIVGPSMKSGTTSEGKVPNKAKKDNKKKSSAKRVKAGEQQERFEALLDWKENLGSRCCDHCGSLQVAGLRCAKCKTAFYCNQTCQKKDWPNRHKHWCDKTKDEFRDTLVAMGLMDKMENGDYALNMG